MNQDGNFSYWSVQERGGAMMDSHFHKEFERAVDRRFQHSSHEFDLDDLSDVMRWSGGIKGTLLARVLSALITSGGSDDIVSSCVQALIGCQNWQILLTDLFNSADISPAVLEVGRQVLLAHMPANPLAALSTAPAWAVAVYNALDDGEVLSISGLKPAGQKERWLLLGLHDPIGQWAYADVSPNEGQDGALLHINAVSKPWLERGRVACPAFVVTSL